MLHKIANVAQDQKVAQDGKGCICKVSFFNAKNRVLVALTGWVAEAIGPKIRLVRRRPPLLTMHMLCQGLVISCRSSVRRPPAADGTVLRCMVVM